MSEPCFLAMDYALGGNPNPNPIHTFESNQNVKDPSYEFEFSDYLLLDDAIDHLQDQNWSSQQNIESMEVIEGASPPTSYNPTPTSSTNKINM